MTTSFYPHELSQVKPLLERSNTPRQVQRTITLERNYTNKRWLYNKNSCDELDPRSAKVDLQRGKLLRRITRREDRQKSIKKENTLVV